LIRLSPDSDQAPTLLIEHVLYSFFTLQVVQPDQRLRAAAPVRDAEPACTLLQVCLYLELE
jgi:hypothetical protein